MITNLSNLMADVSRLERQFSRLVKRLDYYNMNEKAIDLNHKEMTLVEYPNFEKDLAQAADLQKPQYLNPNISPYLDKSSHNTAMDILYNNDLILQQQIDEAVVGGLLHPGNHALLQRVVALIGAGDGVQSGADALLHGKKQLLRRGYAAGGVPVGRHDAPLFVADDLLQQGHIRLAGGVPQNGVVDRVADAVHRLRQS